MRTIYVILLGLILFQGVFIAFAEVFPYSGGLKDDIDDPLDSDTLSGYNPDVSEDFFVSLLTGAGIGGFVGSVGFLWFLGTKNYPASGLCLFIGIILGLLVTAWNTVSSVNITGNVIVASMVNIIFLVIGLLSLFAVVDMFAPQGAQQ